MILYQPPFLTLLGLTFLPDHADPDTLYYLPALPELVVEDGAPAFWTTVIAASVPTVGVPTGDDIARAVMSLDVHLTTTDAVLEQAKVELKKLLGKAPGRLVPAPFTAGKAQLTIARPGAQDPTKDLYVIEGNPPSLVGDNRASFAAAARGSEAQLLVAALTTGNIPAVMSYDLTYLALSPTFQATMEVHWSAVYDQLKERDVTSYFFSADDVQKTVENLESSKAVLIRVAELDPAAKTAATKALFDQLKSELLNKLMEGATPNGDAAVEDRIGDGFRSVLSSILPGSFYILRKIDKTTLQDTTINLHEEQALERRVFQQSTLAGLLARAGDVSSRIHWVSVDDLPNRVESVIIELAPGADRVGVRAAVVTLEVTAPDGTFIASPSAELRPGTTERTSLNFRRQGKDDPIVKAKVELDLDSSVAPEGIAQSLAQWRPVQGQRLHIDAGKLLGVQSLRLELDDPTTLEAAEVEVTVEVMLPDREGVYRRANYVFSKDVRQRTFDVIAPLGVTPIFNITETFRRVGDPDFVRHAVAPTPLGVVRVMNPFGQAWSMEVHAVATWTAVDALVTELRVWDPTRKIYLRDEARFSEKDTSRVFRFKTSPETPRRAEARISRLAKDGTVTRGPYRDLTGPVASVSDTVKAERRIRARLEAPTWAEVEVRRAWVDIVYEDPAHGISASGTITLSGDNAVGDFTHDYPDTTRPDYQYRFHAVSVNGDRYTEPSMTSGADDLFLRLPDAPFG
jgi:hypothetical protein